MTWRRTEEGGREEKKEGGVNYIYKLNWFNVIMLKWKNERKEGEERNKTKVEMKAEEKDEGRGKEEKEGEKKEKFPLENFKKQILYKR